jgi:hypothetical protein
MKRLERTMNDNDHENFKDEATDGTGQCLRYSTMPRKREKIQLASSRE